MLEQRTASGETYDLYIDRHLESGRQCDSRRGIFRGRGGFDDIRHPVGKVKRRFARAAAQQHHGAILIYHTHTWEAYRQTDERYQETEKWRTKDERYNVVGTPPKCACGR